MLAAITPGFLTGGAGPHPTNQALFTSGVNWIVPANVTTICIVAIGAGCPKHTRANGFIYGGSGGALSYSNNIAVTPGETLLVTINSTETKITRSGTSIVAAAAGTSNIGSGQASLGTGQVKYSGGDGAENAAVLGGGGAAGYTSDGGNALAGQGYGGGGSGTPLTGGGAGAPGNSGNSQYASPHGGTYGGGAGQLGSGELGQPGPGGLRVIWGPLRAFPNTNTGDLTPVP